jgi:hypothetical protein
LSGFIFPLYIGGDTQCVRRSSMIAKKVQYTGKVEKSQPLVEPSVRTVKREEECADIQHTFYIIALDRGDHYWYQLRVYPTLYCLGCGADLQALLRTVTKYTRKYGTGEKVVRAMRRTLEDKGRLPDIQYEQARVLYDNCKKEFEDTITRVVNEALVEHKEEKKTNSLQRRVKLLSRAVESDDQPLLSFEDTTPPPTKVAFKKPVPRLITRA